MKIYGSSLPPKLEKQKQMNKNNTLEWLYQRIGGITVGIIGSSIVAFGSWLIAVWIGEEEILKKANIGLLVAVIILLIGIIVTLKSHFNRRLRTENLLDEIFGSAWRNTQFYQRKGHYSEEKHELSKILVKNVLPDIIEKITSGKITFGETEGESSQNYNRFNFIIDSGSTIAPAFKYLPYLKIPGEENKVMFYTNNIAGVGELHKANIGNPIFNETNFYLLGGNPLSKYMATTEATEKATETNFNQIKKDKQTINISIMTSNWIMVGDDFEKLVLCAKGRGHTHFKKILLKNSDLIIIVSPLGKLLKISDVRQLNDIVGEDYDDIKIENITQDKVYLLTTFRKSKSISPLRQYSEKFTKRLKGKFHKNKRNYLLHKNSNEFEYHGTEAEVISKELPHSYMVKGFDEVYN